MRSALLTVILLMLAQPTYKISGRVIVFPGSRMPQTLTLRTYGQGLNGLNLKAVPINGDGTFAIEDVNYGEFAIALGDPFNSPSRNFMLQNGDITDFEMKVPISISGRILMSDGSTLPASLFISATTPVSATNINRAARRTMSSRTEPDTSGKFNLLVYLGDNTIAVENLPDSYAVESITYGGLDVIQNALHLTALPNSTLAITLSHTLQR